MRQRRAIPLLAKVAKEGWLRHQQKNGRRPTKKGADGVVNLEEFCRTDHPCASRHPSFSRRGIRLVLALMLLFASTSIALVQSTPEAPEEEPAWVCPMHTDYTMDIAGKCPRCGMELVHAAPPTKD